MKTDDESELLQFIQDDMEMLGAPLDGESYSTMFPDIPLSLVQSLLKESIEEQELRESEYGQHPTDCDRIDWMFAYLNATGVIARQAFSDCQSGGHTALKEEVLKSNGAFHSYVFYHAQDAMDMTMAVNDGPLELYFRSGTAKPDDDPYGQLEHLLWVNARIFKAARLVGLKATWSGNPRNCVAIELADWRKRGIYPYVWPAGTKQAVLLSDPSIFRPLSEDDLTEEPAAFGALKAWVARNESNS